MPKHLLTDAALRKRVPVLTEEAKSSRKLIKLSDGEGLRLHIRPSGVHSWVRRVSVDGVKKDVTLGQYPAMGLAQAREQAGSTEAKKLEIVKPAARSNDTVRQLMLDWLSKKAIKPKYRSDIERALAKDLLPAVGAKHPADVTKEDIDKVLRGIEARDANEKVRRVRMWLHHMFEFAIDDESRGLQHNPVRQKLRSFKPHKKGHYPAITDHDEVAALMRGIRQTGQTVTRCGLMLSAYLWQRPGELRQATWAEFDLEAAKWTIPENRMKMEREHWVPLPRQAVEMLRMLQGVVGKEGWIFPSRVKRGHPISNATLQGRLNTLGYSGRHCPHGFRAMARTILAEHLHQNPEVLEKHLSHESKEELGSAYDRTKFYADRQRIMQLWADWLDQQV